MTRDSYTLREVAELLGVSKRTLQRRIQEGAFPGRFLATGRHGLETRIPVEDVERALDELRRRGHGSWTPFGRGEEGAQQRSMRSHVSPRHRAGPPAPTARPGRAVESWIPYEAPELVDATSSSPGAGGALTVTDLESLRDAMLAIVREDRESYLAAIRDALAARDQEIAGLRQELSSVRRVVDSVRNGLDGIERRITARGTAPQPIDPQVWADLLSAAPEARGSIDVDSLLREIGELESMLSATDGG